MSDKRWTVQYDDKGHTITQPTDPAYALLLDDFTTTPIPGIYREACYICTDPEFAQMGLPLCYACPSCGGHVPADDTVCSDCGRDVHPCNYQSDGECHCSEIDLSLTEPNEWAQE